MVQIAKELIESVPVRQVFLKVAQMVLAELGGRVALGLQNFGERNVFLLQPGRRSWRSYGRQACADKQLSGDESGASGRAARLGVEGGEPQTLFPNPVDIGRLHPHQIAAVRRDIEPADIVAEDQASVFEVESGRLVELKRRG